MIVGHPQYQTFLDHAMRVFLKILQVSLFSYSYFLTPAKTLSFAVLNISGPCNVGLSDNLAGQFLFYLFISFFLVNYLPYHNPQYQTSLGFLGFPFRAKAFPLDLISHFDSLLTVQIISIFLSLRLFQSRKTSRCRCQFSVFLPLSFSIMLF